MLYCCIRVTCVHLYLRKVVFFHDFHNIVMDYAVKMCRFFPSTTGTLIELQIQSRLQCVTVVVVDENGDSTLMDVNFVEYGSD